MRIDGCGGHEQDERGGDKFQRFPASQFIACIQALEGTCQSLSYRRPPSGFNRLLPVQIHHEEELSRFQTEAEVQVSAFEQYNPSRIASTARLLESLIVNTRYQKGHPAQE